MSGVPALMGACEQHFAAVRKSAEDAGLSVVEADVLEPRGVG